MQVKTNRSLIVFILLTILTCGIYSLFFWHSYVKDVNTICAGDGKNTRGVLALIVFSMLTLGIYALVWSCGMQNRLRENARRYNAGPMSGGGAVVLWQLFGPLLFGLGGLIGTYIQIDSMNRIAYNYMAMHNGSYRM